MPIEYIIMFKIIPQSNNMKESNFSRLFDDEEIDELNQTIVLDDEDAVGDGNDTIVKEKEHKKGFCENEEDIKTNI